MADKSILVGGKVSGAARETVAIGDPVVILVDGDLPVGTTGVVDAIEEVVSMPMIGGMTVSHRVVFKDDATGERFLTWPGRLGKLPGGHAPPE